MGFDALDLLPREMLGHDLTLALGWSPVNTWKLVRADHIRTHGNDVRDLAVENGVDRNARPALIIFNAVENRIVELRFQLVLVVAFHQ